MFFYHNHFLNRYWFCFRYAFEFCIERDTFAVLKCWITIWLVSSLILLCFSSTSWVTINQVLCFCLLFLASWVIINQVPCLCSRERVKAFWLESVIDIWSLVHFFFIVLTLKGGRELEILLFEIEKWHCRCLILSCYPSIDWNI